MSSEQFEEHIIRISEKLKDILNYGFSGSESFVADANNIFLALLIVVHELGYDFYASKTIVENFMNQAKQLVAHDYSNNRGLKFIEDSDFENIRN